VADNIAVTPAIRREVAELSLQDAVVRLRELNPSGLGGLDEANPRRVARALERCLASGRPLRELAEDFARQPSSFADFRVELTRLERVPADLSVRIDLRVEAMLREGLEDEVRRLRAEGLEQNPSAARAIGYREVLAMFDGRLARSELAAEIEKNTRALVKKQRTWFRTQLPAHREIAAGGLQDAAELFER
jgi:tRNA dimethylallyltransferase